MVAWCRGFWRRLYTEERCSINRCASNGKPTFRHLWTLQMARKSDDSIVASPVNVSHTYNFKFEHSTVTENTTPHTSSSYHPHPSPLILGTSSIPWTDAQCTKMGRQQRIVTGTHETVSPQLIGWAAIPPTLYRNSSRDQSTSSVAWCRLCIHWKWSVSQTQSVSPFKPFETP